ncbi:MAG: biotin/lipoyl-binding protein, partial [Chlamydiota bacterium]
MKAFYILFSLIFMVSFSGCKKPPKAPEEVAFPIKMTQAITSDVPVILNSFGTLSPPNTINIKAQVSGEIIGVPFKEGAFVHKDDLLLAIDPSPFLADLQKAQAGVLQAVAEAAYAKESYESYKQLREQDFISVIDLANYLKTSQVADASVLSNLASLQNSKIDLGYTQI